MRALALLATHNERRFVGPCIEHLRRQGVDTYLIDNASTDGTLEIAERHLGDGLIGIEHLARDRVFSLRTQLLRKEELARELDADWFIHVDADELRLAPPGQGTLAEAREAVDRAGCNAVNFREFSFIPTSESPEHDHPEFERTLRTYYPILPEFPHRLNAWKAREDVELAWKAGHRVRFPRLRRYPRCFRLKHYLFLGREHAIEKFVERDFDREEVESGWFGWRASLSREDIRLPSEVEVRTAAVDDELDPSWPSKYHYLDPRWTGLRAGRGAPA